MLVETTATEGVGGAPKHVSVKHPKTKLKKNKKPEKNYLF